jgi:hypothetical protein
LEKFLKRKTHVEEAQRLGIGDRLLAASRALQEADSDSCLKRLRGTIGTQPITPFLSVAH